MDGPAGLGSRGLVESYRGTASPGVDGCPTCRQRWDWWWGVGSCLESRPSLPQLILPFESRILDTGPGGKRTFLQVQGDRGGLTGKARV